MPKDEPAGKKTGLAKQRALAGIQGEKKRHIYHLWKKGRATRGSYKDVMGLCTEKIRRAKAQPELIWLAAVKINKKCFYKYTGNKREAHLDLPIYQVWGKTWWQRMRKGSGCPMPAGLSL